MGEHSQSMGAMSKAKRKKGKSYRRLKEGKKARNENPNIFYS
jgi:hypothetical protein